MLPLRAAACYTLRLHIAGLLQVIFCILSYTFPQEQIKQHDSRPRRDLSLS